MANPPKKFTPEEDMRLLSAARLKLAAELPYFAPLIRNLRMERALNDPTVPTMDVSSTGLVRYNPEYLNAHRAPHGDAKTLAFVLLHEGLHVLLNTHQREAKLGIKTEEDKKTADLAFDCAINGLIADTEAMRQSKIRSPTGEYKPVFPEDFGLPPRLTAESYYSLLKAKLQRKPPPPCKGPGGGCGTSDAKGNGDGEGDGQDKQQGKSGGKPGNGDGQPKPGNGPINKSKLASIKSAVKQAAAQRQKGDGASGEWLDMLKDEPPPKVDWRAHLQHAVRVLSERVQGDIHSTYTKPHKKSFEGPDDPILPTFYAYQPNIVVIMDTSGSMYGDLGIIVSEIQEIIKTVGPVTVIACDAAVAAVGKATGKADILNNMKGGGGTDMRPAIKEAIKHRPSMAVCITDGYIGDVGPNPGFPMIWALVQNYANDVKRSVDAGWGTIVECWDEKR